MPGGSRQHRQTARSGSWRPGVQHPHPARPRSKAAQSSWGSSKQSKTNKQAKPRTARWHCRPGEELERCEPERGQRWGRPRGSSHDPTEGTQVAGETSGQKTLPRPWGPRGSPRGSELGVQAHESEQGPESGLCAGLRRNRTPRLEHLAGQDPASSTASPGHAAPLASSSPASCIFLAPIRADACWPTLVS